MELFIRSSIVISLYIALILTIPLMVCIGVEIYRRFENDRRIKRVDRG